MSLRRKAIVALAAVAVIAVCAWWLWPRNVYRYQGKTVEEWFRATIRASVDSGEVLPPQTLREAFQEMGTNAVPFLASRINRDFEPTLVERAVSKLPMRLHPTDQPTENESL